MTRRRILCRTFMLVIIAATICVMSVGMGRRRGGCVGLHVPYAGEMVEISELAMPVSGVERMMQLKKGAQVESKSRRKGGVWLKGAWIWIAMALVVVTGCIDVPDEKSITRDDVFYVGNLSFSEIPLLNQPTELTFSVTPTADAPNTSINIQLPKGIQLVSGNLSWEGNIEQGKTINNVVTVKVIKIGDWSIDGSVESILPDNNIVHSNFSVYISTSKDISIVSIATTPAEISSSDPAQAVKLESNEKSITRDDVFYVGNLSFSEIPLLNQPTELTFSITPTADAPNTSINIQLPEGIQLVSGNLSWEGNIEQGKTINNIVTVKVIKIGDWSIDGSVESILPGNNIVHSNFSVYISTSKDISITATPTEISSSDPAQAVKSESNIEIIPDSVQTSSTTVWGYWRYLNQDGVNTSDIRYATVELWADYIVDYRLATSWTDANGEFSFTTATTNDVYVKIFADSESVYVNDNLPLTPVYWSKTNASPPGYIGEWVITDPTKRGAWFIFDNIISGYQYFNKFYDSNLVDLDGDGLKNDLWNQPQIEIIWPSSLSVSQFSGANYKIDITQSQTWYQDTHQHEYGHAVMYKLYGNSMPTTGFTDDHSLYTRSDGGFALIEGWAEYIPEAIQNSAIYNRDYSPYNFDMENTNFGDYIINNNGDIYEGNVATILWDIEDDASAKDDGSPSSDDDGIPDASIYLWNVMRDDKPNDINEIWDSWFDESHNYGYPNEMWAIFKEHDIKKPDSTPPISQVNPLPSTISTTSFTVVWAGTDDLSGIKWYDIQIKDGSSGTWTDWTQRTDLTSDTYTGQNSHTYYFRSRAVDNADNPETYPPSYDTFTTINAGNIETTTGSISETHTCDSISMTATYSGDSDNDGSATLFYKQSSSSSWIYYGTMTKGSSQYTKTISGLAENTNCDVYVDYSDSDGVIGTNPIYQYSINTGSCASSSPSTPILNDPGTIDADGSYRVTWSYHPDATYFNLEEDTSSSFLSPTPYTPSVNAISFTGKGNGAYYYRVQACNGNGCSGWSNTESITVSLGTISDNSYAGNMFGSVFTGDTTTVKDYTNGVYTVRVIGRYYVTSPRQLSVKIYKNGNLIDTSIISEETVYYFDNYNLQIFVTSTIYGPPMYGEAIAINTKTTSAEVDAVPSTITITQGSTGSIYFDIPTSTGGAYDNFFVGGTARDWVTNPPIQTYGLSTNELLYISSSPTNIDVTVPSSTSPGGYNLFILATPGSFIENDVGSAVYSIKQVQINIESVNNPPNLPTNPTPQNGAINQLINPILSWTGGDPDSGDLVTYDIYLDSSPTPTTKRYSSITTTSCSINGLNYEQQYYWQVVAKDNKDTYTPGPIWSFSTGPQPNNPPNIPSNPFPINGAINQLINPTLSWTGGDPDSGDLVTYDIYLDSNPNPTTKRYSSITSTSCSISGLNYEQQYYWQIVAKDNKDTYTPGPIWSFSTGPQPNNPPNIPSNPLPINGAINQLINPTLSWTGGDPDSGDLITYDVYLDSSPNPTTKRYSSITSTSCTISGLNYEQQYYWQIVAKDNKDTYTAGPIWSFSTGLDVTSPTVTITYPADGDSFTSRDNTVTVNGTASDDTAVASVTVNGFPATGTTNWSADVTLTKGINTIIVVATDTPGNTATETIKITYTPASSTFTVDDSGGADYVSIQAAIDNASAWDVIEVWSGTYYENVNVNKQLILHGESNLTTIIDGSGSGNIIEVTVDGVMIDGFTIQNGLSGIYVTSSNNVFSNNSITNIVGANGISGSAGGIGSGINLSGSTNNTLTSNTISNITGGTGGTGEDYDSGGAGGLGAGIYLSGSPNNTLTSNTISNITGGAGGTGGNYGSNGADGTGYSIYLSASNFNLVFHNNLQNEDKNGYDDGSNSWDNDFPSGGNYWSDYNGIDANTDGIGDTPYNISGPAGAQDRYPLIIDTTPPASITNLNYIFDTTWINWTWDNPSDTDLVKVIVYINDSFQTDVIFPINYFNVTGLDPDTKYTISTHTVDIAGNINQTWVNHTARTASQSGDGSWQYYRDINIQENCGNTLVNYQVMVELNNTNFPVEADISGADIRFTDANDDELSYWIESWDYVNNNSIIWVNVSSIPAGGSAIIRMWYGNPLAESAINGDATFEFFDDYDESSLDSNKWQTPYSGLQSIKEVSITDSVLSFTGNGCGGACTDGVSLRMRRNFTVSEKMIIETRFRFTGDTWGSGAGLWRQNSLSPVNSSSTCFVIPQRVGIFGDDFYNTNWDMEYSDWFNYNKTIITSLTMNGPWYMSSLAKKNETLFEGMIYSDDSVLLGGNEYNVNFGDSDLTWVTMAIYSCGSRRYYYDWIFVRSYADVEPSVSVGPQMQSELVIINGNFDTDLSGWVFEDASYAGCSVPYGDAIWDNGMARLGAHYAYGNAYLIQNFYDVRPSYFKIDYITNGGCGGISVYLNNGSETVFSFRAYSDSLVSSNSRMMAQFIDQTDIYCSSISCVESSGTLEVYFNNSLVNVYLDDIFLGNFSIAQNFSVDSIRLLSANSCCDGRNDNYGYFDNISLFGSYDVNPPASITNLHNSSYASTYINWTWDNPSDADFAKVKVYLNDVFQTDVTSPANYFNATGLNPDTQYSISTQTVDTSGNINQTWVNLTAITKATGDFSGDGTTDAWDITYLARSIAGIPGYEVLSSDDISGDGVVDIWDCTYLARSIAGIPGYNL